jgi:hypothetical protein
MRTWKEIIKEATADEIRRAGEAALRDERMKNRKISADERAKKRQEFIDLAQDREKRKKDYFDWVKSNAEKNKQERLQRLRQRKVKDNVDAAKSSISGIKTQQISDKDKEGTAYANVLGNVGSAAAGVGGAVVHGVKALAAKRNADVERETEAQTPNKPNIPEKKPRIGGILGGRPPAPKPTTPGTSGTTPKPPTPGTSGTSGTAPNPQASSVFSKPVAKMPTIGKWNYPITQQARKIFTANHPPRDARSMPGSRGIKTPITRAIDKTLTGEEYSNWREELIIEVENNKGKIEKKKIVDVMPKDATNKIDINPNETSIKEAVDQQDNQQIQQQQVQTKNQTLLQQKQQALQQKLQQIAKQRIALVRQGKLALPGTHAEAYKDEEGGMAHNELSTMERAIKSLRKKIKAPNQQLPAWVQSKISKATDYIDTAADYMASETKLKEEGPVLSVGRGEKLSVERGGGLTKKGRDKYNRATGSHLQAPVTGDVEPGSKAAQRRKNFCSRSRSWKGERGLAARRRWKC